MSAEKYDKNSIRGWRYLKKYTQLGKHWSNTPAYPGLRHDLTEF